MNNLEAKTGERRRTIDHQQQPSLRNYKIRQSNIRAEAHQKADKDHGKENADRLEYIRKKYSSK